MGSRVAPGDDLDNDNLMNSLENLFATRPERFGEGVEAVGQSGNSYQPLGIKTISKAITATTSPAAK